MAEQPFGFTRSGTAPALSSGYSQPLLEDAAVFPPTPKAPIKKTNFRRSGTTHIAGGVILKPEAAVRTSPAAANIAGGTITDDEPASNEEPVPSFVVDLTAACFAVFLGAADGLSLGQLLFPHDEEHPNAEYLSLGMSMGLLTSFISNFFGFLTSQFPYAVGGGVLTTVPIMAAYFQTWGPEACGTIMFAVPLMTAISGILTYFVGFIGIQDIVKVCPFVVFGGFIAGTGCQLLEFSLNMMYPKFQHFLLIGSHGPEALCDLEFWKFSGAGIAMGIFMFFYPRFFPSHDTTFLLVYGVFALTLMFYVGMFASGMSIAEARESGWVFDVQLPAKPDFYNVWLKQDLSIVQWDLILTPGFVFATIQAFLMSTLTTSKNIYGTAETTHFHIDINKEVRAAGIQTFFCGLGGAIPGNMVMSYSITAHRFGVRTKRFSALLALISLLFFMIGNYIVAFLPKMVIACVLFWLGILLSVYWMWDAVGHVSTNEHVIVIVMIAVDLLLGPGPMLMLGIVLVMVLSIRRMIGMGFITDQTNIKEVRSDVLRFGVKSQALWKWGEKTLILKLARGYFSFMNATAVVDTIMSVVEEHAKCPDKKLHMLLLNMEAVSNIDATALNALSELMGNADRHKFRILLVACNSEVDAKIQSFGLPIHSLVGMCDLSKSVCQSSVSEYAIELAKNPGSPNEFIMIGSIDEEGLRYVPAYALALEFCEGYTLAAYEAYEEEKIRLSALNKDGLYMNAEFLLDRRTHTGEKIMGVSLAESKTAVVKQGIDAHDERIPMLIEIHCWLSNFYKNYDIRVLRRLITAFEVVTFEAGATIYSFSPEDDPERNIAVADPAGGPVPPLVWVLEGDVEHLWTGHRFEDFSHFRHMEFNYGLHDGQKQSRKFHRLERCVMPGDALTVGGYFQTSIAFFGAMMHPGLLRAVKKSKCVLLKRASYDKICRDSPQALEALTIYINKKRFVLSSTNRCGKPSLQM